MKSRVKTLLNISVADASRDGLIDTLINLSEQKVLPLINADSIPISLEFIVVEMVINRFNRLGSEGINSETVEGIAKTYNSLGNELEPYMAYINEYNKASKAKFRFL